MTDAPPQVPGDRWFSKMKTKQCVVRMCPQLVSEGMSFSGPSLMTGYVVSLHLRCGLSSYRCQSAQGPAHSLVGVQKQTQDNPRRKGGLLRTACCRSCFPHASRSLGERGPLPGVGQSGNIASAPHSTWGLGCQTGPSPRGCSGPCWPWIK